MIYLSCLYLLLGTCCSINQQTALQTLNCPSGWADSNCRSFQNRLFYRLPPYASPRCCAITPFPFLTPATPPEVREVTPHLTLLAGSSGGCRLVGPMVLIPRGTSAQRRRTKTPSCASERRWELCGPLCTQEWYKHRFLGAGATEKRVYLGNSVPRGKMNGRNLERKMNFFVTDVEKERSCW